MENSPQDTTNKPVITPRIKDTAVLYAEVEGSEEPQLPTSTQNNRMNILNKEFEETYLNTNNNIEMFKVIIISDLSINIFISN